MSPRWLLACFDVVVGALVVVILFRRFGEAFRKNSAVRPFARVRTVLGVARTGLGTPGLALAFVTASLVSLGELVRFARAFGARCEAPVFDVLGAARDASEVALLSATIVWAVIGRRTAWPPGHAAHARPSIVVMLAALVTTDLASGTARWSPARARVADAIAFLAPFDREWVPSAATVSHVALFGLVLVVTARGAFGDPVGLAVRAFLRPLARQPSATHGFGVTPEHRARTAEYRAAFAAEGRVRIVDLLPADVARALAEEVPRAKFQLEVNSPVGTTYPGAPACAGYLATMTPHAQCDDPSCAALCRFGESLLEGELLEWLRHITGMPSLYNRPTDAQQPLLAAQAHPKGGYIAPHTDHSSHRGERVALAMIWHAVPRWSEEWGGLLRLYRKAEGFRDEDRIPRKLEGYDLAETWAPRFNELHVFALGAHRVHEVTLVTGDEVRYTIAGRLYEPPPSE